MTNGRRLYSQCSRTGRESESDSAVDKSTLGDQKSFPFLNPSDDIVRPKIAGET